MNFDWLVYLVECPNVSPTYTKEVILCLIIWDVHQFIAHCFIPSDPYVLSKCLQAFKEFGSPEITVTYMYVCMWSFKKLGKTREGGRGHWTVNYTSTQTVIDNFEYFY